MLTVKELLATEEGFEKYVLEELEPYLLKVCESGFFTSFDGTKIAFHKYINPDAKAAVMLIHGFSEFADKYNEMIYVLYSNGYSVYTSDLRCHGESERFVEDPSLVDVKSFDDYVEDIKCYYEQEMARLKLPKYLLGHSMGGAIAVMYTEKYTYDFDKAVFSSPMIRMQTVNMPMWLVRAISGGARLIGRGKKYIVGKHPFDPTSRIHQSSCKSPERYEYIMNKRRKNAVNQTWSGTYNWLHAACKATVKLNRRDNINKITLPVLIMRAGKDHLVASEFIESFADKLKDKKYVFFPEARHEIYHGTAEERTAFYDEILRFFD